MILIAIAFAVLLFVNLFDIVRRAAIGPLCTLIPIYLIFWGCLTYKNLPGLTFFMAFEKAFYGMIYMMGLDGVAMYPYIVLYATLSTFFHLRKPRCVISKS